MAYLDDHPPRIRQFRPRRASLWPVIGVHTAESYPDETGPDTGAENVASFISRRTNYGSYHCLSDSDSRIQLVEFDQAAYHIGTHGLNDRTIGISAATQAAKWNSLSTRWVDATVRNMARDAAAAARYIKRTTGKTVPAKRITLAQALNGGAGFLAHGDADPDRRTDPGPTFPWSTFLTYFAAEMRGTTQPEPQPTPTEDDMPEYYWSRVVGHKENPKLELPKDVFTPVADVLVGPHQLNGVFAVTMHSAAPEVHYLFREFDKDGKARSDVSPGQMENRAGAYWNREAFVINCETGGRIRLYFKPIGADAEVTSLTVEGSLWRR